MKKTMKNAIAVLSAAALLSLGTAPMVNAEDNSVTLPIVTPSVSEMPEVDHGYLVGTMTVSENGETIVGENEIHLYKADGAFILDDKGKALTYDDIKAGDRITYYVDGNAPMTLQLPVHYSPAVIVVETENSYVNQVISFFDEEGLAWDESLKLNYDLSTPYFSHTREAAFISGMALVLYENTTRSIPPQTNPVAIVKLNDDVTDMPFGHGPQLDETEAVTPAKVVPDISGVKDIIVNDVDMSYIPVTFNGVQMLPVRAIAEALGYEVTWIEESRTVNVGFASFSIDEDSYAFAKMAPQSLGQAPVLIGLPGASSALTYVPASFFTAVMNCQMAVVGEALIIAPEGQDISTMPIYQKVIDVPQE